MVTMLSRAGKTARMLSRAGKTARMLSRAGRVLANEAAR
jgi:hypothetical protein